MQAACRSGPFAGIRHRVFRKAAEI